MAKVDLGQSCSTAYSTSGIKSDFEIREGYVTKLPPFFQELQALKLSTLHTTILHNKVRSRDLIAKYFCYNTVNDIHIYKYVVLTY